MKGINMKYYLELNDTFIFDDIKYCVNGIMNDIRLNVVINNEEMLVDQLLDKDKFINDTYDIQDELTNYIKDNFNNIINDVEWVVLKFDNINDREFIDKNKDILLKKKIVLSNEITIDDYDLVSDLYKQYNDIIDNIFVLFEGNNEFVQLSKCYESINKIKDYANIIKNMNLSPMEMIMYIYDDAIKALETKDIPTIGDIIFTVNPMSRIIGKNGLINVSDIFTNNFDIDKFKVEFRNVIDKFNKPISPEIMLRLFNTVRKIRYYNDSKYNYSINDMYKTFVISKWNHITEENKKNYMLKVIFGDEYNVDKEVFCDIVDKNDMCKDVKRTQLTKCLKLYKDKL